MIALAVLLGPAASATTLNLAGPGAQGGIGGALFYQYTAGGAGAGSGNSDEFVRYQAANQGVTQGYNTDGSPYQYDELSGQFTHSVTLAQIPQVMIDGVVYRELLFDINETGGPGSVLSLDAVEVLVASSGALTGHPGFGGAASPVYDMDGIEESWVQLDGNINGSGSGKFDMLLYLPDSMFDAVQGHGPDPFVYVYSRVGDQGGSLSNSDGFEGWARSTVGGVGDGPGTPLSAGDQGRIPEPASGALLFLAALAAVTRRRRPRA